MGKPPAVAVAIEQQFSMGACSEPEETVRQSARAMIAAALAAQRPDSIVQVSASGSQNSTYTDGKWGAPFQNSLEIKVQPLYGFVE